MEERIIPSIQVPRPGRYVVNPLPKPVRFQRKQLHLILFLLTLGTTYAVSLGDGWIGALWYSLGLMTILTFHEMGHFLTARHHGVRASLPYFIPVPLPPFGTMGAVIKMEGHIPNRRALFDVGVSGPLAGLTMIIPAVVIGLWKSQIVELAQMDEGALSLGNSLLFKLLAHLTIGPLAEGQDILLHPLAFAGWVGLLVTALNLLPVGQLDGGHVVYALFGRKSQKVSLIFYLFFVFICLFYYAGWLLFVVVLAIFRRHPPTLNDHLPLDLKRRVIGIGVLILFILAFTPVPFGFGEGLIPLIINWVN